MTEAVQALTAPSRSRWQNAVVARLSRLRSGALRLDAGAGEQLLGEPRGALGTVRVEVLDPAFWRAVALGGALGAGEAWQQGHWRSDDPVTLVRLLLRDREVLASMERGLPRLLQPLLRAWHALRRNNRSGARANIAAHYDLGNDFFAAFLDPSMTYSSAWFEGGDGLEQAQQRKLDRLCRLLDLQPGQSLLEIGSGWGSMAIHAARNFGAMVATTTISAQQHELASARIAAAGLADRVEVMLRDYRDLQGSYDKLVSVEMVEAVGHHYLPTFFRRCSELLRPGGTMALQAITIQDQDYEAALQRVDFIKRHVFPGSFIPSMTSLLTAATAGSDLRLLVAQDFGPHYARTLAHWRARLHEQHAPLLAAGYPEQLLRTWDWYLAYCEGGFAEGRLSVHQLLFTRPSPEAVAMG